MAGASRKCVPAVHMPFINTPKTPLSSVVPPSPAPLSSSLKFANNPSPTISRDGRTGLRVEGRPNGRGQQLGRLVRLVRLVRLGVRVSVCPCVFCKYLKTKNDTTVHNNAGDDTPLHRRRRRLLSCVGRAAFAFTPFPHPLLHNPTHHHLAMPRRHRETPSRNLV